VAQWGLSVGAAQGSLCPPCSAYRVTSLCTGGLVIAGFAISGVFYTLSVSRLLSARKKPALPASAVVIVALGILCARFLRPIRPADAA
jgi:hypothetical protein